MVLFDDELKVVTKRQPTEQEMQDCIFAWKLVKHIKSNGISVAKGKKSLGLGPGQVNRIWAAENALNRAGDEAKGAALASDAFFPFRDGIDNAAQTGIAAVIQPGGSMRDEEVIYASNRFMIYALFPETNISCHVARELIKDGKDVKISGEDLMLSSWLVDVDGLGTFETYPNRDSRNYLDEYGIQGISDF